MIKITGDPTKIKPRGFLPERTFLLIDGEVYIVAQVGSLVFNAIGLESGNRYGEGWARMENEERGIYLSELEEGDEDIETEVYELKNVELILS